MLCHFLCPWMNPCLRCRRDYCGLTVVPHPKFTHWHSDPGEWWTSAAGAFEGLMLQETPPSLPTARWGHCKKTPGVNQEQGFPEGTVPVSPCWTCWPQDMSQASLLFVSNQLSGIYYNAWNGPSQWLAYFSPTVSQETPVSMNALELPYEECHHFP